jgi:hypothetical protein
VLPYLRTRIYLRVKAAQILADDVSGRKRLRAGLQEFVFLAFYFKKHYMFADCRSNQNHFVLRLCMPGTLVLNTSLP